jgi:hypothetical protein|tara:strand:- start:356 stop:682 length:327 start_codon:yes stop_codon:yes gene_type:complete
MTNNINWKQVDRLKFTNKTWVEIAKIIGFDNGEKLQELSKSRRQKAYWTAEKTPWPKVTTDPNCLDSWPDYSVMEILFKKYTKILPQRIASVATRSQTGSSSALCADE